MLRNDCKTISKQNDYEIETLLTDMWETMYNASGVGLAAPQVGFNIMLFTIDSTPLAPKKGQIIKKVFINPVITKRSSETSSYDEGCLSIPGISVSIDRPESIIIAYQDDQFISRKEEYSGINARIIQHEYDHLHGRLFIDLASPNKKQLFKNKLKKIAQGVHQAHYPLSFL